MLYRKSFILLFMIFAMSVLGLKVDKNSFIQVKGSDTPYTQSIVSQIPKLATPFFNTGFDGIAIGCGAEGRTYSVSKTGKLMYYHFVSGMWREVIADRQIPAIKNVAVDAVGTPYVVTTCGQVYYLNCNNKWVNIPGCATDIGVGKGGEVWKVGCDQRPGGYGIWKLYCKSKCSCNCERSCMRFRTQFYTTEMEEEEDHKCYWYRIEGGAQRLDVGPDGNPTVVTNDGQIYQYDGTNWGQSKGLLGKDIAVCNDGQVLVCGKNGVVYALQNSATSQWVSLGQTCLEISCGPLGQPWIVDINNDLLNTCKREFN